MSMSFKSVVLTQVLALALAAGVPATVAAHGYTLGALKIGHPWARPTPNGAPTAAGYLTVTNTGAQADRLLGGSSPLAERIEVHQMSMDGGIMRMRELPGGLALAPGATVRLEPGGYHLMLVGPKAPFKVGDHIPATLKFARAGAVKVEFYVQASPPVAEDHTAMGKMDMH
jgi:copper(I)-binding protein